MTVPLSRRIENGLRHVYAVARLKDGTEENLLNVTGVFAGMTVKEKEYELPQATLSVYDNHGIYGKLLEYGTRVDLSWGVTVDVPLFRPYRSDEIINDSRRVFERGPMTFSVVNSGADLRGGRAVLNVDLLAFRVSGAHEKKTRRFDSGTLEDAIRKIASEIGARAVIRFGQKSLPLTRRAPLQQTNETNIALLKRVATEYDVKLVYAHNRRTGTVCSIILADHGQEKTLNWPALTGRNGKYHYLDYGVGNANMMEGWNFSRNNSAPGGSTFIPQRQADGRITIRILVSKSEQTYIYTLNTDRIRKDAREKKFLDSRSELSRALKGRLAGFDYTAPAYRRYFDVKKISTAPEGFGHHGRGQVVFSPLYQVGDLVWVGLSQESAVPAIFRTEAGAREALTNYRIREQELTIDAGGWKQALSITR